MSIEKVKLGRYRTLSPSLSHTCTCHQTHETKAPGDGREKERKREREGNEKLKQKIRIKKEAEMSEQILTRVFDQGNWRFRDEISVPPVHLLMRNISTLGRICACSPEKNNHN